MTTSDGILVEIIPDNDRKALLHYTIITPHLFKMVSHHISAPDSLFLITTGRQNELRSHF